MDPFVHDTNPARIVFGDGKVAALGDEVERLGCSRTLVVCTPGRTAMAEELSASLGDKRAAPPSASARRSRWNAISR